jgi:predicted phosphodiesterase
MVLALLHLSDMHLRKGKSSSFTTRVPQIVAGLRSSHQLLDYCLVVVSGDIAFSGQHEEYAMAEEFFAKLRTELAKYFATSPTIVVPGNHDCEFNRESDVRRLALESLTANIEQLDEKGKILPELLAVQGNFFNFDALMWPGTSLSETPWLIRDNVLEVGSHRIGVLRLNTAFVSRLQERQASLVFPTHILPKYLNAQTDTSLVISVFHHPYSWLESSNAHKFKSLIETRADVVLTGHEHVQGAFTKELITGERLEYVEGAVLGSDDPDESAFNVVICDLAQKAQKIIQFKWNGDRYPSDRLILNVPGAAYFGRGLTVPRFSCLFRFRAPQSSGFPQSLQFLILIKLVDIQ